MAREAINFNEYKVQAYIDTNIILECRPLSELPWEQVDSDGPILLLISPTVMKEIDSKKQDGRVGKRARAFNRLIAPMAVDGVPILIRQDAPRVEIVLSRSAKIPWDKYDELDAGDNDSCIIAEILNARDVSYEKLLLISHDIKPIAYASFYDLASFHVDDEWLRPTEPSRADRENQKLRHELSSIKASQPEFEAVINLEQPVNVFHIQNLLPDETDRLEHKIIQLNPKKIQSRDPFGGGF